MARDKTDVKNKEILSRIQEKAARINAVTAEKMRKDEQSRLEKMEREKLLESALKNDQDYLKAQESGKKDKALKLHQMHEKNL